jgi:hypothetical protein
MILMTPVVAFTEGQKNSRWKNAVFIETNGLGHSMHSDKLYKQVYHFLLPTYY